MSGGKLLLQIGNGGRGLRAGSNVSFLKDAEERKEFCFQTAKSWRFCSCAGSASCAAGKGLQFLIERLDGSQ